MSSHTTVFEQISSETCYGKCYLGLPLLATTDNVFVSRDSFLGCSFFFSHHVLRMQAGNYMAQDGPRDKGNLQP